MNRSRKLVWAASATVIILTVGLATAADIEFAVNPNKLPPCPEPDYSKKNDSGKTKEWSNCWGRYIVNDYMTYRGGVIEAEWLNGIPHGQGIFTYVDGRKYVGEYQDGKITGQGTLYFLTDKSKKRDKYVGEFNDGIIEGRGTLILKNGDSYVGEFRNGMKSGQGTLTHSSGATYVGGWSNDVFHGQGALTYANGNKYIGEFYYGNYGRGTLTFTNGDKYVGEWRENEYHGQGEITFASGERYIGEFKNGMFHGQGTGITANGGRLVGVWEKGKFIREAQVNLSSPKNDVTTNTERTEIEGERKKLAEERRLLEEEKLEVEQKRQRKRVNLKVSLTRPDTDGSIVLNIQTNADTASLLVNGEEQGSRVTGDYSIRKLTRTGQETVFNIVAIDINGNTAVQTIALNRPIVESQPKFVALNPDQVKKKPESDAVAIIIGIADYKNLPRAEFANVDARLFYQYAIRALGVKPENIKLLVDGDADDIGIHQAFKTWLPSRVRNSTDVYVYYSGHGLLSADGLGIYLLPHKAHRDPIDKTAIKQQDINSAIQAAKPKSVFMFLDARLRGQARTGETLQVRPRPVTLKAGRQFFPDGFTVISASQAKQITSGSPKFKHGISSYYLMRGMEGEADANRDGKITVGEMHGYLSEQLTRQAGIKSRRQQPQLVGDANRVLVEK